MTADIKVGDKIHVEFEVAKRNDDVLTVTRPHHLSGNIVQHFINDASESIVKHIPKPWEPKEGEEVRIKCGYYTGAKATILAVHDTQAWIKLTGLGAKRETLIDPLTWLEPL